MQSGLPGPADNGDNLINILFPLFEEVSNSECGSDKMGGMVFFEEMFGKFEGVGGIEPEFLSFNLGGKREIDFNRDDVYLPDKIFRLK